MLVLDPLRRYTIEQIKRHRWMTIEVMDPIFTESNTSSGGGNSLSEPNEQIIRLMTSLGIDTKQTRENLKVSTMMFAIKKHNKNYRIEFNASYIFQSVILYIKACRCYKKYAPPLKHKIYIFDVVILIYF